MCAAIKGDVGLYLSGNQVLVKECGVVITPPSLKQICMIGEESFLTATQLIGKSGTFFDKVRTADSNLREYGDLQILLVLLGEQEQFKSEMEEFFLLICPDYNIQFDKASIKFVDPQDENAIRGMLNPFNFPAFQEKIRELFSPPSQQEQDFNPANEAARKIAEKIKKARERKNKNAVQKENISLYGTYVSILAIGMQMDMNVLFSYTPFQIYDTFTRYWLKVRSDFYQRISTTPMMDTSKIDPPDEWTKSLYGGNDAATDGVFSSADL